MERPPNTEIRKLFLLVSSAIVAVIALLYGISPDWFARIFLDTDVLSLNFAHILRAITGLYLALAGFWAWSAFNREWTRPALLTTVIFAGGLVSGRIISLFTEGLVAPLLTFYMLVELAFVPLALWVFRLED